MPDSVPRSVAPLASRGATPWSRAAVEGVFDLRRLRYFVAVAEELSFTRAAQRLRIAQPPLSQQIRALERALGVDLFERVGRRVTLAAAGEQLLGHARRIINATGQAVEAMHDLRDGRRGTLSIGALYSSIYTLVPRTLRALAANYPDVVVRVQEMTIAQQLTALRDGSIDIGILRGSVADADIISEPLFEESLIAVVPADHPLAAREAILPYELAAQPFIGFRDGFSRTHRDLVAGLFAGWRQRPKVVHEVSDMHTLIALVGAGLGVSIVPASLQSVHIPEVAYRPLSGAVLTLAVSLAWHRESASLLVPLFARAARDAAAQRDGDAPTG